MGNAVDAPSAQAPTQRQLYEDLQRRRGEERIEQRHEDKQRGMPFEDRRDRNGDRR